MMEDAEDEWFYDSITRYKQLRMFDCANVVRHMDISDKAHICIVGRHERSGKDEISELLLPQKVTVHESDEGLVKDCDMRVQSGCFTKAPVFQMRAMSIQRQLVTSEEDQYEIMMYDLNSDTSDLIRKVHNYRCAHKTPSFSITSSDIVISSTTDHPVECMDMHSGQVTKKFQVTTQSNNGQDRILPQHLSENVVAICNVYDGSIYNYDIRNNDTCSILRQDSHFNSNQYTTEETWAISPCSQFKFGVISSQGKCVVYDMRDMKAPICKCMISEVNILQNNSLKPNITPVLHMGLATDHLSTSGFDDKVYLYRIKSESELEIIFVHDGHSNRISDESNFVNCHVWLKDDTLISAADNNSIHCWQYVGNKSQ